MSITFACPICEAPLSADDNQTGEHITCQDCETVVVVPAKSKEPDPAPGSYASLAECPKCNQPLQGGAILCVACGYHLQTGETLTTTRVAAPQPQTTQSQNPDNPYASSVTEKEPALRFSLSRKDLQWASDQVQIPGWGLMVSGYGMAALWAFSFAYPMLTGRVLPLFLIVYLIVGFFVVGANILIGRGGQNMLNLDGYSQAMTACFLSLFCLNIFALPFAVWGIVVLHNKIVIEAFGR